MQCNQKKVRCCCRIIEQKNAAGFKDASGRFHPIRSGISIRYDADGVGQFAGEYPYDPKRAGEVKKRNPPRRNARLQQNPCEKR
jgi:hypothetical protein